MDFTAGDKPQVILHIHKSLNYTLFDTKWIPASPRCVLLGNHARGTGALQIMNMKEGELQLVKEKEKTDAIKCGTFGHSSLAERSLATGDFKGMMEVWDLENLAVPIYTAKAHNSIINCIDGCGGTVGAGAPEIVTASRDGCVRVWDPRQKDVPVAALEPGEGEAARDCWCVSFGNAHTAEDRCVAAGFDNGDVKLWDLRTNEIRWETCVGNGVCGVEFDRVDIPMNKLVATTLENLVHCYDVRTQHPHEGFASKRVNTSASTIWSARHLPQNRDVFAACCGNGDIMLYKYSYPKERSVKDADGIPKGVAGDLKLLNKKNLSTQPICSFDWHPDKRGLCVMGSFDQSVRVAIVTQLEKV